MRMATKDIVDGSTVEGGAGCSESESAFAVSGWWRRPIPLTLLMSATIVSLYAAFERIGTQANADVIEYTTNLGGGFLAVGMTDDQPGFIVLSALDQTDVKVSADQVSSVVAGEHTRVEVRTPSDRWTARLRGPQVVVVDKQGAVTTARVDWRLEEFVRLRDSADCAHSIAGAHPHCGAPFADLQAIVSAGLVAGVPDDMRRFLDGYREPSE